MVLGLEFENHLPESMKGFSSLQLTAAAFVPESIKDPGERAPSSLLWAHRQCWRSRSGGTALSALFQQVGGPAWAQVCSGRTPLQACLAPHSTSVNITQGCGVGFRFQGQTPQASEAASSHKMTSVQGRGARVPVLGRSGGFRDALTGFSTWGHT